MYSDILLEKHVMIELSVASTDVRSVFWTFSPQQLNNVPQVSSVPRHYPYRNLDRSSANLYCTCL